MAIIVVKKQYSVLVTCNYSLEDNIGVPNSSKLQYYWKYDRSRQTDRQTERHLHKVSPHYNVKVYIHITNKIIISHSILSIEKLKRI